jgi:predicted DNA-binding transcriptional regulator AlpA
MHTQQQREAAALRADDLLTCKQVCAFLGGIHSATLYRGIAAGRYPAPIKVGPNTSRWLESECEAALAAMVERRAAQ